jgi:hypothetical protein
MGQLDKRPDDKAKSSYTEQEREAAKRIEDEEAKDHGRFGGGYGDVEEIAGTPKSRRRPPRNYWSPKPF